VSWMVAFFAVTALVSRVTFWAAAVARRSRGLAFRLETGRWGTGAAEDADGASMDSGTPELGGGNEVLNAWSSEASVSSSSCSLPLR